MYDPNGSMLLGLIKDLNKNKTGNTGRAEQTGE